MYKRFGKRILDFSIAAIGLIVLSPLFLLIALVLLFLNKGKILFQQSRPGLNAQIFTIFKFSTMSDKRDLTGVLLADSERATPFGNLLRRTSLDELPQLWNVLIGQMSLIGPRPLLIEYLPYYSLIQHKRHLVKPGITGWAQVNGRNSISWAQKFELDVYYVQNISFLTDMKIIVLTFEKLLNFIRVAKSENVVQEKFAGESKI